VVYPLSDAPGPPAPPASVDAVAELGARMLSAIETVIDGKAAVIRTALVVLFAEGHLLIEDVPGVGKTMLAKALAAAMSGTVRRIQFTPDLLPSDVSVYEPERRTFEFRPGAVFANVVIGDEINRASPKTQSALLECMEERQVTVDGQTFYLAPPFFVVATQNPVEMEGTYPLPEAQRDRFTAQVAMGYPSAAAELAMLDSHTTGVPLDQLKPVTSTDEVAALTSVVRSVHVATDVRRYIVDLVTATRRHPELRLGASPRAGLQLLRSVRAAAAMEGRAYVLPDDVQALAGAVLSHRLLLTPEASASRRQPFDIVAEIVSRLPIPVPVSARASG
jgi:MoxR-like ATPase